MKTILELRRERESLTSIRKMINLLNHLCSDGIDSSTPVKLVEEVVDKLNIDWYNPHLKILDVKSNKATFSLIIIEKLLSCGHHIDHILDNMIYAIDGDKIQSMTSNKAFLNVFKRSGNIYHEDFLTYDFKMKFDLIVGNPPYQESKDSGGGRKDQASNLWSKFWVKSLEIASDNGKVALITPSSWTSPSSDLRGKNKFNGQSRLWDVFNSYSSYANVTDVAKYFPGIGSTFSIVTVDKSGRNGLTFSNGEDTDLGFLPKSNHTEVSLKLNKNNNLGSKYSVNQDNKPTLRVSVPLTRVLDSESVQILNGEGKPTSGSEKEKLYLYAYCDTLEEAKHIQERVISSIDILNTHCRWSGFMNIQVFKMIKI